MYGCVVYVIVDSSTAHAYFIRRWHSNKFLFLVCTSLVYLVTGMTSRLVLRGHRSTVYVDIEIRLSRRIERSRSDCNIIKRRISMFRRRDTVNSIAYNCLVVRMMTLTGDDSSAEPYWAASETCRSVSKYSSLSPSSTPRSGWRLESTGAL